MSLRPSSRNLTIIVIPTVRRTEESFADSSFFRTFWPQKVPKTLPTDTSAYCGRSNACSGRLLAGYNPALSRRVISVSRSKREQRLALLVRPPFNDYLRFARFPPHGSAKSTSGLCPRSAASVRHQVGILAAAKGGVVLLSYR